MYVIPLAQSAVPDIAFIEDLPELLRNILAAVIYREATPYKLWDRRKGQWRKYKYLQRSQY